MKAMQLIRDLTLDDGKDLEPFMPLLKGHILFAPAVIATDPNKTVVMNADRSDIGLLSPLHDMFAVPTEALKEIPDDEI